MTAPKYTHVDREDREHYAALIRQNDAVCAAMERAHPELFRKPMDVAVFEHCGERSDPTPRTYQLEADHLRCDGAMYHAMERYGESAKAYRLARAFEATARKLRWQAGVNQSTADERTRARL